jgi:hypothetical protein
MKNEFRLREITLGIISILVWFEILWAVVFLVGLVFQWSGLTNQLMYAFFGSGFCGLVLLAALAILNFSANLSIISKAQMRHLDGADTPGKSNSFLKPLVIAGGLICLVVASLWIAEWKLLQTKLSKARSKIEMISNSQEVANIIKTIYDNGTKKALFSELSNLSNQTTDNEQFSVIFPKKVNGKTIYYEIGSWRYSVYKETDTTKISDESFTIFKADEKEKPWFDKQTKGKDVFFAYPKGGDNLRAFLRVETPKGFIILLLDTSRRSSYQRDSF